MSEDRVNELNQEVTGAIYFVDQLTDRESAGARAVYARISRLEEEIATLVPASKVEGAFARRGAVRAAMDAGDERRATDLAATYVRDGASETLAQELHELLKR